MARGGVFSTSPRPVLTRRMPVAAIAPSTPRVAPSKAASRQRSVPGALPRSRWPCRWLRGLQTPTAVAVLGWNARNTLSGDYPAGDGRTAGRPPPEPSPQRRGWLNSGSNERGSPGRTRFLPLGSRPGRPPPERRRGQCRVGAGNAESRFAGAFERRVVIRSSRACSRPCRETSRMPPSARESQNVPVVPAKNRNRATTDNATGLFAGLLCKPSDGLEPSTPSLPRRFWDGTGVHGRASADTFFLQIGMSRCVVHVRV
jgi:hypothetical protein